MINKGKVMLVGGAGYLGFQVGNLLIQSNLNLRCVDMQQPKYLSDWTPGFVAHELEQYDFLVYMATNMKTGDDFDLLQFAIDSCNMYCVPLIYISSAGVMNSLESSPYVNSKRHAEMMISKYSKHWTVIRPASMYGLSSPINWSSLPMSLLHEAMTTGEMTVKNINEERPIIHVSDVARIIKKVIFKAVPSTHNIFSGATENYTKHEMASIIMELLPDAKVKAIGNTESAGYAIGKGTVRTLNILHTMTLKEGLKEIIDAKIL